MAIFLRIYIIIVLLTLTSCCTKVGCDDAIFLSIIQFNNFSSQELQSVNLIKFNQGSNYLEALDTIKLNVDTSTNLFDLGVLNQTFKLNYDYQIIVDSTQKFNIQNFEVETEKCNDCFLGINQDYYSYLGAYTVNGIFIKKTIIEISK